MAELRRATVEFDKNEKRGIVYVEFLTELTKSQDRVALTAKFKEDVEPAFTEDGFSWSNLFKITRIPTYDSGHKWIRLKIDLLRAHMPLEWSEEYYEDQITNHVRHLCYFIKRHVDFIEKGLLQGEFPEVSKTIQFVED